ncbi:helix-turn-helix domain-containing protein [Arcanobacterium canis]
MFALVAATIRAEIARRNMEDKELAKRAGLAPSTLSRRLKGKGKPLDIDEIAAIADVFGLEAWQLVEMSKPVAA